MWQTKVKYSAARPAHAGLARILTMTAFLCAGTIVPSDSHGQWKRLLYYTAPYQGTGFGGYYAGIYFLDLPGPPQIGFVGDAAKGRVLKTTDGGQSWYAVKTPASTVCPAFFAFKDSLNGWFADDQFGGQTTDAGETWDSLPIEEPIDCYYNKQSRGLFILVGSGNQIFK